MARRRMLALRGRQLHVAVTAGLVHKRHCCVQVSMVHKVVEHDTLHDPGRHPPRIGRRHGLSVPYTPPFPPPLHEHESAAADAPLDQDPQCQAAPGACVDRVARAAACGCRGRRALPGDTRPRHNARRAYRAGLSRVQAAPGRRTELYRDHRRKGTRHFSCSVSLSTLPSSSERACTKISRAKSRTSSRVSRAQKSTSARCAFICTLCGPSGCTSFARHGSLGRTRSISRSSQTSRASARSKACTLRSAA